MRDPAVSLFCSGQTCFSGQVWLIAIFVQDKYIQAWTSMSLCSETIRASLSTVLINSHIYAKPGQIWLHVQKEYATENVM